nr:hypothetical protein [Propionicimonas sp.]
MPALVDRNNTLHVVTRVRGGRLATLTYPGHHLSPALGALLARAMLAARDAGPCAHLKPDSARVLVLALGRAMCVDCAFGEAAASWHRGAPCVLCEFPVANLVMHDQWPEGKVVGVTRSVFTLCPDCIRAECGAEVCV